MTIQPGDRFYVAAKKDFGTVVMYKNYKNWAYRMDKEPRLVKLTNASPHKVAWVKVGSIIDDKV